MRLPSRYNESWSYSGSLETFHQKLSVPGPVMMALRVESLPSAMCPLCAASLPSKLVASCPLQSPAPEVDHVMLVSLLSRASASEMTWVTMRTAFELVSVPTSFWTTQLYWPASESCTL